MIFRKSNDKNKDKDTTDIGIRLLKMLLLRLYSMLSTNPLKWYEILISVIMGLLFGLGIGSVMSSSIKIYLQLRLICR
jgi:xanthine/uracil permease